MNPGNLNQQAYFEVDTAGTKDSFSAVPERFVADFDAPCAFEEIGGREFPSREKRNAETTARFRLRYDPRIAANPNRFAATHRIRFSLEPCSNSDDRRTFNIYPPLVDGVRREIVIEASEIQYSTR